MTAGTRNGAPMTAHLDVLAFDGEPFDALLGSADPGEEKQAAASPRAQQQPTEPRPDSDRPEPTASPAPRNEAAADQVADLIRDVRAELVATHLSAMAVQSALQRRALAALGRTRPGGSTTHPVTVAYTPETGLTVEPAQPGRALELPSPATTMSAFKALARTQVTSLDQAALAELAGGDIAAVFGAAYDQHGDNPDLRLASGAHANLTRVTELTRHGGPWHRGRLRAEYLAHTGDILGAIELAWQAAQVFALQTGLHLCLAGVRFHAGNTRSEVDIDAPLDGTGELILDVVSIDLIPRPWLRVRAELRKAGAVVARVRDLVLEIREAPGTPVAPEIGGVISTSFGRYNADGERALLNEFHMTHSARGDLGIALGPEFSAYAGRRATRMPNHGLQLCDRVMAVEGRRGDLTSATARTEYDSPADSWYYAETANASMPNVVYMETSLQSALLLGYFLGATLTAPEEDYSLRNLDGTATVLREVELRGKTIRQKTQLLSTTVLVGAVLQSFSYELSVDGEPFYRGESLFGFFNETALANQNGLDNGAFVPTWFDAQQTPPAFRTIDVAARRAEPGEVRAAQGHLALLDTVDVVDGGGKHGRGYLRAVRPVADGDWFFAYHFHLDPVMPGSLGVEAVLQALQEWALDAGLADGLTAPEFVVPAGLPLSWRYRGQILADDREMTLEVHIEDVQRRPGRVRVIAEASVWKPGLRIYELTGVAVELRGAGAEPW
ncbi:3-hydroxymyristoyl/3-hydroxydecanoyl-(acyl carrier protein) dehydratase [Amycolatopsis echigonensis]|uniref:3-hydroxymyristoyl/3-hydroxydecanoyl-(Acyl carrier protein) dehydratase n=2 Tax=Amycolatopsis echigonensis TaxID=2576905 RepID=A0A2N3WUQ4_9PSEU|nr:3-hydroxymyristoyl/3-hydroxydecanoyl-(acyl carrier protein) dehydratase [Amycolatopsis niigatensis]